MQQEFEVAAVKVEGVFVAQDPPREGEGCVHAREPCDQSHDQSHVHAITSPTYVTSKQG